MTIKYLDTIMEAGYLFVSALKFEETCFVHDFACFWRYGYDVVSKRSALVSIVAFAFLLRLIMPLYSFFDGTDPISHMFQQHSEIILKYANDLFYNRSYSPYGVGTFAASGVMQEGMLLYIATAIATFFGAGDYGIFVLQIFQGIVDSFGCLLVYRILLMWRESRIALSGAFLYAIWPPSIFYSYHIMIDAFVPILFLGIGYALLSALERGTFYAWALMGVLLGLLLSLKFDNALILPSTMLFVLGYHRGRKAYAIRVALFLAVITLTSSSLFSQAAFAPLLAKGTTNHIVSVNIGPLGKALYNSLGEYPGTFKGLRFFDDKASQRHAMAQAKYYRESGDQIFALITKISPDKQRTAAFVREVIVENPMLYLDWIIQRTIVYISAHPYIACITHFLTSDKPGWKAMLDYRYSATFNTLKYLDYLLFCLFALGAYIVYKSEKRLLLGLLAIYVGVLIGHVFTSVGEVYFRKDMTYSFIELRYLLGMVTLWPIFIAISVPWIMHRNVMHLPRVISIALN